MLYVWSGRYEQRAATVAHIMCNNVTATETSEKMVYLIKTSTSSAKLAFQNAGNAWRICFAKSDDMQSNLGTNASLENIMKNKSLHYRIYKMHQKKLVIKGDSENTNLFSITCTQSNESKMSTSSWTHEDECRPRDDLNLITKIREYQRPERWRAKTAALSGI
jgi:hypothetical protein